MLIGLGIGGHEEPWGFSVSVCVGVLVIKGVQKRDAIHAAPLPHRNIATSQASRALNVPIADLISEAPVSPKVRKGVCLCTEDRQVVYYAIRVTGLPF